MVRHPFLWTFAAAGAGILWAEQLDPASHPWVAWAFLLALAGVGGLWVWALRRGQGVFVASLLGIGCLGGWSTTTTVKRVPPPPCGAEGRWQGTILEAPRMQINEVTGVRRFRTVLGDLYETCDGVPTPWAGRVATSLPEGGWARGDTIIGTFRIDSITPRLNPVGRDPILGARAQGVVARAIQAGQVVITRHGRGPFAWIDRQQHALGQRFEAQLSREAATLTQALILGERGGLTMARRDAWARTGLAHLLAISGLHIGTLAWLLYRGTWWLGCLVPGLVERTSLRRVAAAGAGVATVAFCLWVGSPHSAVRATIMAGAVLLGVILRRSNAVFNALGFSGTAMLVLNPLALYDVGFLLSFAAVVALLRMPSLPPATGWWRLLRGIAGAALAAVATTLLTLPIIAQGFGQLSWVAPFTNVVAVPWATLVAVPVTVLYGLLAWFGWGEWMAPPVEVVLGGLEGLVQLVDTHLHPALALRPFGWAQGLSFAAAVLITMLVGRGRRWRYLATCAWLAFTGVSVGYNHARPTAPGTLEVWHPYVGQGDATIAFLPDGAVLVFDAGGAINPGGWDPGQAVLVPLLRSLGVRAIDIAVVSHPDPDHLNGFVAVSKELPIRELWWSGAGDEHPVMQQVLSNVRARGGQSVIAGELPDRFERHGVDWRVVHPRPQPHESEGLSYYPELSPNDNSVVLRLQHGARSALLPGDLEAEAEAMVTSALSPVDWVKAPHHGSRTSSTQAFVEATSPEWLIISCGVNNQFGFPVAEVVERWERQGTKVLRTDQLGMIRLVSDGKSWVVHTQVAPPKSSLVQRSGPHPARSEVTLHVQK